MGGERISGQLLPRAEEGVGRSGLGTDRRGVQSTAYPAGVAKAATVPADSLTSPSTFDRSTARPCRSVEAVSPHWRFSDQPFRPHRRDRGRAHDPMLLDRRVDAAITARPGRHPVLRPSPAIGGHPGWAPGVVAGARSCDGSAPGAAVGARSGACSPGAVAMYCRLPGCSSWRRVGGVRREPVSVERLALQHFADDRSVGRDPSDRDVPGGGHGGCGGSVRVVRVLAVMARGSVGSDDRAVLAVRVTRAS